MNLKITTYGGLRYAHWWAEISWRPPQPRKRTYHSSGGLYFPQPNGRGKSIPSINRRDDYAQMQKDRREAKKRERQARAQKAAELGVQVLKAGIRNKITGWTRKSIENIRTEADVWAELARRGDLDPRRCVSITLGAPDRPGEDQDQRLKSALEFKKHLMSFVEYLSLGRRKPFGRPLKSCVQWYIEPYPDHPDVPHAHLLAYFPDLTDEEFPLLPDLIDRIWMKKYPNESWLGRPTCVRRLSTVEDVDNCAHYFASGDKLTRRDLIGEIGARWNLAGREHRPKYVAPDPVRLGPLAQLYVHLAGAAENGLEIVDGRPLTFYTAPHVPASEEEAAELLADMILSQLPISEFSHPGAFPGWPNNENEETGKEEFRKELMESLLRTPCFLIIPGDQGGQELMIPLPERCRWGTQFWLPSDDQLKVAHEMSRSGSRGVLGAAPFITTQRVSGPLLTAPAPQYDHVLEFPRTVQCEPAFSPHKHSGSSGEQVPYDWRSKIGDTSADALLAARKGAEVGTSSLSSSETEPGPYKPTNIETPVDPSDFQQPDSGSDTVGFQQPGSSPAPSSPPSPGNPKISSSAPQEVEWADGLPEFLRDTVYLRPPLPAERTLEIMKAYYARCKREAVEHYEFWYGKNRGKYEPQGDNS